MSGITAGVGPGADGTSGTAAGVAVDALFTSGSVSTTGGMCLSIVPSSHGGHLLDQLLAWSNMSVADEVGIGAGDWLSASVSLMDTVSCHWDPRSKRQLLCSTISPTTAWA